MISVRCFGENKFFKQCPTYIVVQNTALPCFCWEHIDQENVRNQELDLQKERGYENEWEPLGAFTTNNAIFPEVKVQEDRLQELAKDDQNVHTPEVQMGVHAAIRRLEKWANNMKAYKDLASLVHCETDPLNLIHIGAIEHLQHCYLWNDDTKMFGTTYPKLATWVWERIQKSTEFKDELIQRFLEEVYESKGQCLNGNMARLMNVFVALDPEMSPHSDDSISNFQVQNLIAAACKNSKSYEEARHEVILILQRARIEKWDEWLVAVRENFD